MYIEIAKNTWAYAKDEKTLSVLELSTKTTRRSKAT